jgi:tRNA (guanine-N7-)-methyltransferase
VRRRVRQHVNPLGRRYLTRTIDALPLPLDKAIDVELGCADARFLFDLAPQFPDRYYVGLEIREPLVDWVNEQATLLGLPNLRAYFAHINLDLDELFADHSLARVYINFPDPWFKTRHHKRRLVTEELVEILHRKVRPDGEVLFQSDIFELAIDAMATFETQSHLFANTEGPWSFRRTNPYPARSEREVRNDAAGNRTWRMLYRPLPLR